MSETLVATEYRPTLAALTKAGSMATSRRAVTWLATVAPWPRAPYQSVVRPRRRSTGPTPIRRTDRARPTASTSAEAALAAIRALCTVIAPRAQSTTNATAVSAGCASRSTL